MSHGGSPDPLRAGNLHIPIIGPLFRGHGFDVGFGEDCDPLPEAIYCAQLEMDVSRAAFSELSACCHPHAKLSFCFVWKRLG